MDARDKSGLGEDPAVTGGMFGTVGNLRSEGPLLPAVLGNIRSDEDGVLGVRGGVGGCDVGELEAAAAAGGVAAAAPNRAAESMPGGAVGVEKVDAEAEVLLPLPPPPPLFAVESLLLFC